MCIRDRCSDDPKVITGKMQELLTRCDAVITSGGVSVGQKDYPVSYTHLFDCNAGQSAGCPALRFTARGLLTFCHRTGMLILSV